MSGLRQAWARTHLRDIATFVTSGSRGWARYYAAEGAAFVRIGNIKRGTIALDWEDMQRVQPPRGGEGERTRLQDDDVLITITADLGRVAIFRQGSAEAYINQHVALARLVDGQWARYVAWYLASDDGQAQLLERDKGTTKAGLGLDDINSVEIPFPPPTEQRRIVAKLDALTARTARARADLDRIPALAARYKQAVLAKAFSGELTAAWRASNRQAAMTSAEQDQARQLAWSSLFKRRGKYERAEVADWKPDLDLPETWRWASVDELTAMVQYGSSAKTSEEVAVPVLRMGNIVDGVLDLAKLKYLPEDHDEFPELLLDDGDLLFNRTNSAELVGKTAVFRGAAGSTSFASYLIRLKSVGYHPELLAAYINSPFGRSWVVTATSQQVGQANVNGTKLRGLGVPLMPLDEQLVIWERVKHAFAEIDRLTTEAAAARRLLDRLDQAVLAKAFRGELVPQDPADEPAGVLLDRIRAERAAAPKARRGRKPARAAG